jgi:regulator of RNase E activity RraA
VIRDASSNIYCNVLNGTATSAQYADLAEKYLADQEYDTGTVVVVGGEKEVTASTWGKRAIGVVSANPAFMMNRDLEGGTYIALKGRVPVKIIGSVKKGDNLIAANDGCASVAVHHSSEAFAVALESNSDTSVKLVEAVIL